MISAQHKPPNRLVLALLVGVAWCTLAGKSERRASRTLAVKEAIRSGLTIDARRRLTAGSDDRGGLSPAAIRDALHQNDDAFVECILQETRRVGPVAGVLELRVDIDGGGQATDASVIGQAPPRLSSCLEDAVRATPFPGTPEASASRATVRLELDASLVGPAIESALVDAAQEQRQQVSHLVTLSWPVDNTKVNSKFGRRPDPLGNTYQFHTGVDLRAKMGQAVKAAAAGRVVYAGWRTMRGKEVVLEHENGLKTGYGHLSQILVSEGQWVAEGMAVGRAGSTGKSTWPHLHFEVSLDEKKLDPLQFLGKRVDLRKLRAQASRGKKRR